MSGSKVCVYCGAAGPLTDDHVPPKNLFPKPRPSNLITVPACRACNGEASKDDEYFRQCLCLSEDGGAHPEAAKHQDTIFRSLQRDEAAGQRKAFIGDIRQVEVISPGGLYLGRRKAFDVKLDRLFRVVQRSSAGCSSSRSAGLWRPGSTWPSTRTKRSRKTRRTSSPSSPGPS